MKEIRFRAARKGELANQSTKHTNRMLQVVSFSVTWGAQSKANGKSLKEGELFGEKKEIKKSRKRKENSCLDQHIRNLNDVMHQTDVFQTPDTPRQAISFF